MLVAVVVLALAGWLLWKDHKARHYWRRLGADWCEACPLYHPRALLRSLTPGLPQICRLYQSSSAPILGFFKGRTPILMIRDPALVVAIMHADFQHFTDKRHPIQLDKSEDPLSQHLIGLTGEKWKTIRSKLTPIFSSGKIKESLPLIEEAVDDILPELGAEAVDIYPLAVTLVTDVILSYAFGLSREDPNRGLVRTMGMRSIHVDYWTALKRAIRFCFPKLFRLLRLRAFEPEVTSFFVDFVKHAILKIQSSRHIGRADFISRLDSVAAVVPEEERDGVVAAQVFSFYVAGFETTCFALSTSIYELSKNPIVVMKARKELDALLEKHSYFSYEALQEATYLSQIIQESMRMYPADYATPRICTSPYRIPGTNVVLEKGTEVLIPGFCLSRDPKYYKDPLKFDPERFSKDNKADITPGTYLPFGDGPRKCIAVRFSTLELKYVLARLISAYDLQLDPSTPQQLTFDENSRVTHYCGRIEIRFNKRLDLLSEPTAEN